MSVQAVVVSLHVLHALIRTFVVRWSAYNLNRSQYQSVAARHVLQQLGATLAESISEDDVIAVELTHESEVFMLGIVIPGPEGEECVYRVMEHAQSYMGRLEPGDRVIQVRKFEPTQLGSNLFRLTQKEFPVFIEDVRLILDNRDLVSDGTPQRRISARAARQDPLTSNQLVGGYDPLLTYRLSSHSKEAVLKLVPEE